jgi:hypothetical protein
MPQDPAIIGVSLTHPPLLWFSDAKFSDVKSLYHRERKTMWIFSVAFLLRTLTLPTLHIVLSRSSLTRLCDRCRSLSHVKMARRKTSSVSNRHQTSPLTVSSRPVAILLSAALVAQEVHTRTALARKVAFRLVDRDRSQADHLVHLVCPHLHLAPLPAGSHQGRASTSPQDHSHHTCRAVLRDCTTRISHRPGRGVVPLQGHRLAKTRRLVGSQRLLRQMAHPSHRRRSKVRSRQETHRPQLQLPSKLLRPQSTRSQTSHLRLLRHTRSLRNKLPRDRRAVASFLPFLFPAPEPPRQYRNHNQQQHSLSLQ